MAASRARFRLPAVPRCRRRAPNASFGLQQVGSDVDHTFVAVHEPSTDRHQLDSLATVIGCDVDLDDRERAMWLAENVRHVAEAYGLEHLRVCYHGGPNCGTCEKCVLTRICLDVLGVAAEFRRFPGDAPPLDGRALHKPDASVRNDRIVLRAAAVRAGGHERLVTAIDVADFARRRPTLAGRLQLKERLRGRRHRRRFARNSMAMARVSTVHCGTIF